MIRDDIHRLANIIWKHEELVTFLGETVQSTKSEQYDLLRRTPEEIGATYLRLFRPLGVVSPYQDPEPSQGLAEAQREFFRSVGVSSKGQKCGKKVLPVQLAWLFFTHPDIAEQFCKRSAEKLRASGASEDAAALNAHRDKISKADVETLENERLADLDRPSEGSTAPRPTPSGAPLRRMISGMSSMCRTYFHPIMERRRLHRVLAAVILMIAIAVFVLWPYAGFGAGGASSTLRDGSTMERWAPVAIAPLQIGRSETAILQRIIVDEAELTEQGAAIGVFDTLDLGDAEDIEISVHSSPIVSIGGDASGLSHLSVHGQPVRIMHRGTMYAGFAGREIVFTLDVSDLSEIEFRLHHPLDHSSDDDGDVVIEFPLEIADRRSGNSTLQIVQVNVRDDVPSVDVTYCNFAENNLFGRTSAAISGRLHRALNEPLSFGADGPGFVRFSGGYHVSKANPHDHSEDYHSATSALVVTPTSDGVPVEIDITDGSVLGTANDRAIFRVTLNQQDGTYRYEQYAPLDHYTNGIDEVLYLSFSVRMVDFDGDSANSHLEFNIYDQTQHSVAEVVNSVRQ